jgi:hypothetical protein
MASRRTEVGERHKDVNWELPPIENGSLDSDLIQVALLMDIRDELRKQNQLLTKFLTQGASNRVSPQVITPRKSVGRPRKSRPRVWHFETTTPTAEPDLLAAVAD